MHTTMCRLKCLPIHLMYLNLLLHKGDFGLFCDQGTLTQRSTVFMYSVCKQTVGKKIQPLSQSELKAKMKLYYLFLYNGEIQRETVARKCCNLTLNLCNIKHHLCIKNEKAHKDMIQGLCPGLSGTLTKWITRLDFKVIGGYTVYVFHLVFGVLDNLCHP